MLLKVAITGNIASGKTQTENIISEKFPVYDTDKMAHEALDCIIEFYGFDVFSNGKIDRKKLGKLVFANNNLKQKLESIIHPKVKEKILNIFDLNKENNVVFISVPLLYETGFDKLFDIIILVTTDEETRIRRLIARDNLTQEEAEQRIKSQLSEQEKIKKADFVIQNKGDLNDLRNEVDKVLNKILK